MSDAVYDVVDANGGVFRLRLNGTNLELLRDGIVVDARPRAGVTSYTINGGDGRETLIIDALIALPGGVFFNGGLPNGQPGDAIIVAAGPLSANTVTHANTTDGSIMLSDGTATASYYFTGIDPVDMTGSTANNLVLNLPAGSDQAFLEDDGTGGNATSRLRSANGTFETTTFAHPTVSLSLNGAADDTITIGLADSLAAASVNATAGTITVSASNGIAAGSGITLTADAMTLAGGSVNAGAAAVFLQPLSGGQQISLGGADAAGTLGLSAGELNTITAGRLVIGHASAGRITTAAGVMALLGIPARIELVTGADIVDGFAGIDLNYGGVSLAAQTGIGVTGPEAAIDVVAANLEAQTATGGINLAHSGNPVIIGGVGNLVGLRTLSSGDITLTSNSSITVGEAVAAAGGGNVLLASSGAGASITVNPMIGGVTSASGAVTLRADDMAWDTSLPFTSVSTSGTLTLTTGTAGRTIVIGADMAGALGLTAAELQHVSGGTLVIGDAAHTGPINIIAFTPAPDGSNVVLINNTGGIAIGADLVVGATASLTLTANGGGAATGAITRTGGTLASVQGITLNAATGIGAFVPVAVSTPSLAAVNTGATGPINIEDAVGVTVSALQQTNAANTTGDVFLTANGSIALANGAVLGHDLVFITASLGSITDSDGGGASSITMDAGELRLTAPNGIGTANDAIDTQVVVFGGTSTGGSIFINEADALTVMNVTAAGQFSLAAGGAVTVSGTIMTGTGFTLDSAANATINGAISGGGFTQAGSGTTTMNLIQGYAGATTVAAGTLLVNGALTASATSVAGGTLGGNGQVGSVTVGSGGTLAPGASAGMLTTGNVSLAPGARFSVEIGGPAPGTQHDLLNVIGSVGLGGANLQISIIGGFAPAVGQVFTILSNDGADAVSGTFAGLAEGTKFAGGGRAFQISYLGGSGNDVTLTAVQGGPPVLNGFAPADEIEQAGPSALPQVLDGGVTFTDPDGDFAGGMLMVSGLLAEDGVGVRQLGSGSGQFQIVENGAVDRLMFEGVDVGGVSGGAGSTLTVTFNGNATVAAIDALIENLTYLNASADPAFTRTLSLEVTDALGFSTGAQPFTLKVFNGEILTGTNGEDSFTASGNKRIDARGGIDTVTFGFRLVDAAVSHKDNMVIVDGPGGSHAVLIGVERFVFTDGTVRNDDADVLVDDLFYYARYHDVWNAHAEADAHYHSHGWREGRDPSAFFSTSIYLSANQDVKSSGVDPLDHFHQSGWKEGRLPALTFDVAQYLVANPDIAAAAIDPLAHFLGVGAAEGRLPFAPAALVAPNGFDYVYYLSHNPDVAAAQADPLQHFLTTGWKEGRNPNALFDTKGYLATYADVASAHVNPLDHYHQFGWREGRDPSVAFDTTSYRTAYPDVAAANVNPLAHFIQFGQHEGRLAFADGVWG